MGRWFLASRAWQAAEAKSRRRSLEPFIATHGHATLKTDKSELHAARVDFNLAHDSPG
jgi:hypothetical protein